MDGLKRRFRSKTYWMALILAALTIIEAQYAIVAMLVPAALKAYMPLIFPLAMMFMREVTKEALADK